VCLRELSREAAKTRNTNCGLTVNVARLGDRAAEFSKDRATTRSACPRPNADSPYSPVAADGSVFRELPTDILNQNVQSNHKTGKIDVWFQLDSVIPLLPAETGSSILEHPRALGHCLP